MIYRDNKYLEQQNSNKNDLFTAILSFKVLHKAVYNLAFRLTEFGRLFTNPLGGLRLDIGRDFHLAEFAPSGTFPLAASTHCSSAT